MKERLSEQSGRRFLFPNPHTHNRFVIDRLLAVKTSEDQNKHYQSTRMREPERVERKAIMAREKANHFTEQLVQMYLDGKIATSGDLTQFIYSHYAACEPEMQYGTQRGQSEKTEAEVVV